MSKIKLYCNKIWHKGDFKQVALIPCPYVTYNPTVKLLVISLNFLVWDIGIYIFIK
jgi:hypothetical protein